MSASSPFGDSFGDLFGTRRPPAGSASSPTEKGVAWQAKEIDGKLFVPLEQVVELLAANDVLPKMRAALERRLS